MRQLHGFFNLSKTKTKSAWPVEAAPDRPNVSLGTRESESILNWMIWLMGEHRTAGGEITTPEVRFLHQHVPYPFASAPLCSFFGLCRDANR